MGKILGKLKFHKAFYRSTLGMELFQIQQHFFKINFPMMVKNYKFFKINDYVMVIFHKHNPEIKVPDKTSKRSTN
jgi:hypothetical protein